jgi:hypothetical protein
MWQGRKKKQNPTGKPQPGEADSTVILFLFSSPKTARFSFLILHSKTKQKIPRKNPRFTVTLLSKASA